MELKLMFNKSYPNPWQSKISSGAIIVYYLYSLIYFEIVVQALHPCSCRNMRTPVLWIVLSVGLGSSESWSNKWEKGLKNEGIGSTWDKIHKILFSHSRFLENCIVFSNSASQSGKCCINPCQRLRSLCWSFVAQFNPDSYQLCRDILTSGRGFSRMHQGQQGVHKYVLWAAWFNWKAPVCFRPFQLFLWCCGANASRMSLLRPPDNMSQGIPRVTWLTAGMRRTSWRACRRQRVNLEMKTRKYKATFVAGTTSTSRCLLFACLAAQCSI